ncbi:7SK snRNA methylphosphate capping enzyme-like [Liolophura sinensis]|uniref:7SK snRNA methylphosphate capping enzyme-like n=1 Tax=Liolophura sinensis TaxID=3198878 RepID=UPI003158C620
MSVEVKTPTRTQFEHVEFQCGEKQSTSCPYQSTEESDSKQQQGVPTPNGKSARQVTILGNQQKPDGPSPRQENKQYQTKRRRFSVPAQRGPMFGSKKRRYSTKQDKIVLPTKFLLGGNISDPLNLNSLYDDETGMLLNEKTPNSSPLPFPVHRENTNSVFPPNITDPLNLNSGEDVDDLFTSRLMARKRRRHKHKKKQDEDIITSTVTVTPSKETEKKKNLTLALKIDVDSSCTSTSVPERASAESDSELLVSNQKKCEDKIVSPVIPQTSKGRKRRRTVSECMKPEFWDGIGNARRALLRTESVPFDNEIPLPQSIVTPKKMKRQTSAPKTSQPIKRQPKAEKRRKSSRTCQKFVYGNYNRYYGYRNPELDQDVRLNSLRPEWFAGKDILDIGCNVGHITLAIACDFRPRKIVGMDIDGRLIAAARKNIRYYLTKTTIKTDIYPLSVKLNYGPIVVPAVGELQSPIFPNNIMFLQGNYVLEFDELLDVQKEEYDVIMALSITKWIHLNFGDDGMKRFFKRIFKQLRPGGRLILEPQAWPSYKKKKKLTDEIFRNFQSIRFKPDQFTDYLLSREVGFSTCEALDVPYNKSAGFRRPIQLFTKPDTSVNSPNPIVLVPEVDNPEPAVEIPSAEKSVCTRAKVQEDKSQATSQVLDSVQQQ